MPFAVVMVLLCFASRGIGGSFPISTISIQNATRRNQVGLVTGASQYFRYLTCAVAVTLGSTVLLLALGFSPQAPDADRLIFEVSPERMVHAFQGLFALMGLLALIGGAGFALMEGRPMAARVEHPAE